jgi:hypothetical protein
VVEVLRLLRAVPIGFPENCYFVIVSNIPGTVLRRMTQLGYLRTGAPWASWRGRGALVLDRAYPAHARHAAWRLGPRLREASTLVLGATGTVGLCVEAGERVAQRRSGSDAELGEESM